MNRQATADPTRALMERLLGWLPSWLGFALIILAGLASIIVGAMTPSAGLIAFGVWAIVAAVLAWWAGATSEPRINPFDRSFGGVVSRVPDKVWYVIAGLFVIAILIAIFAR
jgi:hypothetical protein